MQSSTQKRLLVALSALALCAVAVGACDAGDGAGVDADGGTDAGTDAGNDAAVDTGSDVDTGEDSDDDGDDCYEDFECEVSCNWNGSTVSGPLVTPVSVNDICGSNEDPVHSDSAAVLVMSGYSTGFIGVPSDLLERVVGLPEVAFEGLSDPKWSTFEIDSLQATDGGFTFHVVWPLISPAGGCSGGGDWAPWILSRIRFSMSCGDADAGQEDAGPADGGEGEAVEVESVRYFEHCYSDDSGSGAGWFASGETCPYDCYWDFVGGPC